MDIIFKSPSILEATEPYIMHGCNAQGKMGSGVAKVLSDRYPEVREQYIKEHADWPHTDKPFLGSLHVVETDGHTVFNAITQEFYGYDGKLYASYDAIKQCLATVNEIMHVRRTLTGEAQSVAMPLLGCGLAGGDWNIVGAIIADTSTDYQPVVYLNGADIPGI